jgi:hypothetical protein
VTRYARSVAKLQPATALHVGWAASRRRCVKASRSATRAVRLVQKKVCRPGTPPPGARGVASVDTCANVVGPSTMLTVTSEYAYNYCGMLQKHAECAGDTVALEGRDGRVSACTSSGEEVPIPAVAVARSALLRELLEVPGKTSLPVRLADLQGWLTYVGDSASDDSKPVEALTPSGRDVLAAIARHSAVMEV